MSIFRSTDPTTWDAIDGIVINESAPAPSIGGVAANKAILVGQFQRGPTGLYEVGSIGEFHEQYGKSTFSGNQSLKNKKFGRLILSRVVASDAVLATKAFQSTSTDRITFSAKQGKGAYGNNIQVKIENGSTTGTKYTIHDNNTDAVLRDEVYDNVAITAITSQTFAASKLVTAVVNSTAAEPTNSAYTSLASGSDGAVADTDYQTAIAMTEVEQSGNVLFLDSYNATRNGYLVVTAANTQDKMVIVCGAQADSRATAVTAAASSRDVNGRVIYAYPYIQTTLDGVSSYQNPASWLASIMSQTSPDKDPAWTKNAQYLVGATGLDTSLTRADYVLLKAAGICAFEVDSDIGMKVKDGVVTQIADSSKVTILRRRMADYLTMSAASFLKNYQNAPNSMVNRSLVKGAILEFVQRLESQGMLPKDSEVNGGKAKLVDTESLNTNSTIAAGFFKILWRQRIYSSMRYIVVQAEIGESVVVTEQSAA